MATDNSKIVKKHMKAYQTALRRVQATIMVKGNGGYPAQAAEVATAAAAWTPIA